MRRQRVFPPYTHKPLTNLPMPPRAYIGTEHPPPFEHNGVR